MLFLSYREACCRQVTPHAPRVNSARRNVAGQTKSGNVKSWLATSSRRPEKAWTFWLKVFIQS
jgi:hypothetical protein